MNFKPLQLPVLLKLLITSTINPQSIFSILLLRVFPVEITFPGASAYEKRSLWCGGLEVLSGSGSWKAMGMADVK